MIAFFCDENVSHFSGQKQIKEKVQVPRCGRWRANVGRQVYKTIIALLLVLFGYCVFSMTLLQRNFLKMVFFQ